MSYQEVNTRQEDSLQRELAFLRQRVAELESQTALRESKEQFQALITASAQIVWTTDTDGVPIEDSPSWRAFTGQSYDEYRSYGWLEAVHPEDQERTAKTWAESVRTATSMFIEYRLRHISGEWRWTAARGVPLFHPDGTVRGWVGMNTDITARKKGEEEERERQLQTLADSIPQLVWMANSEGWIFWYNRRWYEYTGTNPEEMQGWGWQSVHHPEILPGVLERWRKSIATGDAFEMEFPLRGADGVFRWFLTRIVPVRNASGAIMRWYGTNTDIDALRRAKDALWASEARFRTAVQATTNVLWTNNVRGEMEGEQPGWAAFTGQSYEEYQGYGWSKVVHPDDAQPTIDEWNRAVTERRMFVFEHRVRRRDGLWRICSIRALPVLDEKGTIREWVGKHIDITDERTREKALQESEARFRQLADAMPQIVWTARPDGYLDYYNERWYQLTGFERGTGGNKSWEPVLHPDDLQPCYQNWYASVQTGQPFQTQLRFFDRRTMAYRWHLVRALPVRDGEGQIAKWFGTSTDIDDQKQTEEALRRSNQDLEQFAYAASHDLQEPLRMVATYTQMLARKYSGHIDEGADQFITYAVEGAQRMGNLLDGLLQYSRAGAPVENTSLTDSTAVLEEALRNLEVSIRESGAAITSDPLPGVRIPAVHLLELFQNLISNAIKYRNETSPCIHLSARQEGKWVYFEVVDNGIGIKPEYAQHIFGVFRQLHKDKYGGTGIGLAICKRIVERFGGRIWVDSQLGRGARFCFTVPAL